MSSGSANRNTNKNTLTLLLPMRRTRTLDLSVVVSVAGLSKRSPFEMSCDDYKINDILFHFQKPPRSVRLRVFSIHETTTRIRSTLIFKLALKIGLLEHHGELWICLLHLFYRTHYACKYIILGHSMEFSIGLVLICHWMM